MPRYDFTAGQILTAAQMDALSDQTVMTFAGTAARGSAIPTPVEGMVTYLNDANGVSIYDGSAWKRVLNTTGSILQVVSTTKTDTFSSSLASGAFADITGLSATITPTSATSKILIFATINGGTDSGSQQNAFAVRMLRDSTAIAIGDASSSRGRISSGTNAVGSNDGTQRGNLSTSFLDSPATTSAITYKVQIGNVHGSLSTLTMYVNRTAGDGDSAANGRASSTITIMEVAA